MRPQLPEQGEGLTAQSLQGSHTHLNLAVVALPPIILALLDEIAVAQRRRAFTTGLALGAVGAAQYLIATEIFAASVLLAVIGLVVLAVCNPSKVRQRAVHALEGLGVAVVTCGVLIGYPLAVQLGGPDRFTGSAHGSYAFPADLLATVIPSPHQLIAPGSALAISSHFILTGDAIDNGSYLGIPLLVLLVSIVVWRWRMPLVRFAAAMAIVAELLALGPTLTVGNHHTGFPLPDRLLEHLPLFDNFFDARFSLYVDLFCAILLAVALDQLRSVWRRGSHTVRVAAPLLVIAAVVVPLLPAWPYASAPVSVPAAFSAPAVLNAIPSGSVALTYPYPTAADPDAMLWQVAGGMRYRLIGGYAIEPGPTGGASFDAFPSTGTNVPATLLADQDGTTPAAELAGAATATPAELRRFLEHYGVDTVLVDPVGVHPNAALHLLESAIGTAPRREGHAYVWLDVRALLKAKG